MQDVISKEGAIVRSTKCLDDEFVELEKAEGKDNTSLVMKANYIKRKSQEKSCKILSLEEAVAVIAEKGRKLRNKV